MLKTVSSITNAIGALNYKGAWNANTNSPALASGVGTKGDYYVVGTAGSTTLDGISNWGIGDWTVFNGSVWQRVEGGADLNGVNLSFTGVASGPTYETSNLVTGLTISGNSITADGTDSDININLTAKGAGGVRAGNSYFKASDNGTYYGPTDPYHSFASNNNAANWTLQVRSNAATATNSFGIRISYAGTPNSTGAAFWGCDDGVANRATMRSNGGLANFQSNNVDLSDARTKKEITPAASMWGKVGALEIVTYKYNDQTHDDVNLGVIAQQVEAVEPVWVGTEGWGEESPEDGIPLKTVYTKDITFAAIKALQEAMLRIEALELQVLELKGN